MEAQFPAESHADHQLTPHVKYKTIRVRDLLKQASARNLSWSQTKHGGGILESQRRRDQATGISAVQAAESLPITPVGTVQGPPYSPDMGGTPRNLQLSAYYGEKGWELDASRRKAARLGPINAMKSFDLNIID